MAAGPDPRVTDAAARLGKVLKDKWRLTELLGVGGMAAVYAATHRNGKRVAIKLLHREYSVDPEVKGRFLREGYLVNKVEHAGVVGVLDDDAAEDGSVFLVMDLLEGESLEQRRRRKGGALPVGEVLSVADQVLDVLGAAHAVDLVHRDLKPENLFLCKDGAVKLLDFGIARLRELSVRLGATHSNGSTMGTPAFMPPEQARGHWAAVDGRTDLWALGATMFTLLTGKIVHEAPNVGELLICAMMHHAPALSIRMSGTTPLLCNVVDRALKFDQADRWPDARTMQAAVRDAYREAVGHAVAAPALVVSMVGLPRVSVPPTSMPAEIADPSTEQVTQPRARAEPLGDAQLASVQRVLPQFASGQLAPAPVALPGPAPGLPFVVAQLDTARTPARVAVLLGVGASLALVMGAIALAVLTRACSPAQPVAPAMGDAREKSTGKER